jgi:transposase-like protein
MVVISSMADRIATSEERYACRQVFRRQRCTERKWLWRKILTTNLIERCFVESRRQARRIACFVNMRSKKRNIFSIFNRFNLEWCECTFANLHKERDNTCEKARLR